MNKFIFTVALVLFSISANAQSWQWGKRGGSTDNLGINDQEEVQSMVTDSHNNIYIISSVGKNGLDVDGVTKTYYGDSTTLVDVVVASFSCDGTYRWSKIIGGANWDIVNSIQIDNQDNVYISGKFGSCNNATYPPRIENDVIISQTPQDCSLIFLAKFNSSGDMLWFKRPQLSTVPSSVGNSQTGSWGLSIDSLGNTYWLVSLPAGVYANGAFTTTLPGAQPGSPYYILKYDSNGNFVSGTYLDMQLQYAYGLNLQFKRNPNNGYFYFTSTKSDTPDVAVVGGQAITHTAFIACFNDLGQFQWVREDTATSPGRIFLYNLDFDSDNNIYLGGRMTGFGLETFLGLIIPESIVPGFIMKVNPTASSLIWSSYNNTGTKERGAIAINGNEIAYTSYCATTNFTWGTQVLNASNINNNEGTEVLLARFNRSTGACIQLSKIPGNVGFDDWGTALAIDSSGDYILGGNCGGQMTFATNSITTIGPQGDFFVAKYATSPCSLGTEEFFDEGLLLYPNPAETFVSIITGEKLSYVIYNVTGSVMQQGIITSENNSIDISALAAGCYVISTKDENGGVKRGKLVKR